MMTVLEVAIIIGVFILPVILTPKKRSKLNKLSISADDLSAEYGVDPDGYLVRL
jgi:hypothetical protein